MIDKVDNAVNALYNKYLNTYEMIVIYMCTDKIL